MSQRRFLRSHTTIQTHGMRMERAETCALSRRTVVVLTRRALSRLTARSCAGRGVVSEGAARSRGRRAGRGGREEERKARSRCACGRLEQAALSVGTATPAREVSITEELKKRSVAVVVGGSVSRSSLRTEGRAEGSERRDGRTAGVLAWRAAASEGASAQGPRDVRRRRPGPGRGVQRAGVRCGGAQGSDAG